MDGWINDDRTPGQQTLHHPILITQPNPIPTTQTHSITQVYNILGCPGAQFSRVGDMVPFPSLVLALLVMPLRAACALLLLPFLLLFLALLLAASLLWLPAALACLLVAPCLEPPARHRLGLGPDAPQSIPWALLFPVAHRLHVRRARLASDLVLGALVTALLLVLTCLEAFWLPMGVLVCLASLVAGAGSCRDALSALFMPVYMLNALMSGRA